MVQSSLKFRNGVISSNVEVFTNETYQGMDSALSAISRPAYSQNTLHAWFLQMWTLICTGAAAHGLAWPAKACLLMASKLKLVGVTSSWRRKNTSNQWMMLEIDFESTHRQVRSHRSKGVFLLCMWLGLEAFYGGTDPFTYLLCSCLSGRLRQCNAQNFIELHAKIKTQQP